MGFRPQAPIAVNASGGAAVALIAKTFARGFTIQEDGAGAQAGLTITWPDGSTDNYTPAMQPIKRGNISESGTGEFVGVPANYSAATNAATQYCTVVSMGAATSVLLTEYN